MYIYVCMQSHIHTVWETGRLVYRFQFPNFGAQKRNFQGFFLYFNKKYVEVAINHSQCILLFRNSLEGNADRREKQEGRRERKLSMKVFSFI